MGPSDSLPPDQSGSQSSAQNLLDRRTLLRGAAAAGIVAPAAGALAGLTALPTGAAPTLRQTDPATLLIAMNGSPSDLDPHSVYDYRSAMPLRGPY